MWAGGDYTRYHPNGSRVRVKGGVVKNDAGIIDRKLKLSWADRDVWPSSSELSEKTVLDTEKPGKG